MYPSSNKISNKLLESLLKESLWCLCRCKTKVSNLAALSASRNFDYMSSQHLLKGENSHSEQALFCCAVCGDSTLLLAGCGGIADK